MRAAVFSTLATASAALSLPNPRCRPVAIPVDGSAHNRNLTGIPMTPLTALTDFYNQAPVVLVTGEQTLAGTFCEPAVLSPNNNRLQVLFGSATVDRSAFQAQGGVGEDFPPLDAPKYSWTDFANAQGYPTLNLDRLGTGKSSHPDPYTEVQAPYEIALYNNLAERLRAGTTTQLLRPYTDLLFIGAGYASQLGAGLADAHPSAYNQSILTGFNYQVQSSFPGVQLTEPTPARDVDPARFGALPHGYLTTASQPGRTNTFFGDRFAVAFDPAVAAAFFARKDVVSAGQFASIYALPYVAPHYQGRVLVLNGEQDQVACGRGSPVFGPAACGPQLKMTGEFVFPAADYNFKSVDRTGHAVQLHESAQKVFAIAHRFLAGEAFHGGAPA